MAKVKAQESKEKVQPGKGIPKQEAKEKVKPEKETPKQEDKVQLGDVTSKSEDKEKTQPEKETPKAEDENKAKLGEETSKNENVKPKSKLIGSDIVLDPKMSGMFVDPTNKITLGFMDGQVDRVEVTETMELNVIKRNITKGVLRVFNGKKDITEEMGGHKIGANWKMTPVVEVSHKPVADADTPLVALLNRNSQAEVIKNVTIIKNYKTLSRLKELEEMGKNPASQPRADVLNKIIEEMKAASGISEVGKIEEDKVDIIDLK